MPYSARRTKYGKKRSFRRYHKSSNRRQYAKLSKRISAVSKRVAGEVCKFESTPSDFENQLLTYVSATSYSITNQNPLNTIQSGVPWVMPINWIYKNACSSTGTITQPPFYNGTVQGFPQQNYPITVCLKNPLYYNTILSSLEQSSTTRNYQLGVSTDFQYRLKYIYINALFNASISSSQNNTDGALRIVIIKDKQPTGGSATWYDNDKTSNSRGVFNAQRIDAQLNPQTVGRFKICYDKTLRFNTINGYKPFKYYKKLSTICRNNRNVVDNAQNIYDTTNNFSQTPSESAPVQKNAYYIMMFSDGLEFTYSANPATPAASFHLFNRVAYYNN